MATRRVLAPTNIGPTPNDEPLNYEPTCRPMIGFMTRFSHAVSLGLVLMGLAACGAPRVPAPSQAVNPAAPADRLSRIVDRYWEEHLSRGTGLSPQFMADSLAFERRFSPKFSPFRAPGWMPIPG